MSASTQYPNQVQKKGINMRLNKDTQYGILFSLYLSRAGRATLEDAASELKLPKNFLAQVVRKMRLKGLVRSVRGPGGGYELTKEVTPLDILNVFDAYNIINSKEQSNYLTGGPEERAFALYAKNLSLALYPLLARKIKNVMSELVANEVAKLDKLDMKGLEQ